MVLCTGRKEGRGGSYVGQREGGRGKVLCREGGWSYVGQRKGGRGGAM